MKLFVYDHCPYCVKARMIFGIKNVPLELITLLNDDEETPRKMIGQKMLPILEKPDGEFMPESLDIVSFIDNMEEFGKPMVEPSAQRKTLQNWLVTAKDFNYRLAMPRWPKMDLEEFATKEAVDYFTNKKEQSIGPFAENLQRSFELIVNANSHLQILDSFIVGTPYFWGETLSVDDFDVFASLRCLTTAKGIVFPSNVKKYLIEMSERTKVPLHWNQAI